jgi:hypothetical protein
MDEERRKIVKSRRSLIVSTIVLLLALPLVASVQAQSPVYPTELGWVGDTTNPEYALGAPDGLSAVFVDTDPYTQSVLQVYFDFCTSLTVYGQGTIDVHIYGVFGTGDFWEFTGVALDGSATLEFGGEAERVSVSPAIEGTGSIDALKGIACTSEPQPEFGGFLPPIASDALNEAKAGRAVPVNFSLGGDFGLDILESTSAQFACDNEPVNPEAVETVSAGASSLNYDPETDLYTYVWKTEKAWSGTCRQLSLTIDGETYVAGFQFK